jgi:hypothetical protein
MRDAMNKIRKALGLRLIWWGGKMLPEREQRIFALMHLLGNSFRESNPREWDNITEGRPPDAPQLGQNVVPFEPRTLH